MPVSSIISTPAFSSRIRMKRARSNIEWPVARRGNEEQRILRVGLDEALDEFGADFIAWLADQRTDRGDDAAALGAELFHRRDGRFQDAGQRALPAGMRRADHAGLRIDEQDRPAIGGGGADRKALDAGDDGVGARARRRIPGLGPDHDIGRMDLVQGEKMRRRNAHVFRHPAAIFGDMGGIVARADAGIEARIDAAGDAALAREESVAQARNGREQRRGKRRHGRCIRGVMVRPPQSVRRSKPASAERCGSETPSTLNIEPMPPRPPPISRFSAPAMSSETSGVALAIKADGAGFDAEPLEEIALRHRAVDARADILGGAHQRLEIHMGGDVGLAGIFQRVGEAMAGDGLEGIAGIAAQMAVIDDQRRAVLVADAASRSS